MTTTNLNRLELDELRGKGQPKQHCKATFPLLGAHGTKETATVYFEIAPGDNLGMHTDSAEELLVILEGEAEVIIGDEKAKADERTVALVPVMVPHDIINTGDETLKVLGIFGGANNIVATFDYAWMPGEISVIDTEEMTKAQQEQAV